MIPIILQKNMKVEDSKPLDAKYFNTSNVPYTNTVEVLAQIPVAERYEGLTVNVASIEYWFLSGILTIKNYSDPLKEDKANKSTSVITDGTSDVKYPSVKAVKDYADSLVEGLLDFRGGYDASGNTFPSTGGSGILGVIMKGDMWIISVAGVLGGEPIQIGDSIVAMINTPGQTASNWDKLNSNISYVPEDQANKVTSISGSSTDIQYPTAKLLFDQLATKEPSITIGTSSQYWRGDKTFQTLNTTAVAEGTNLYYTDVRVAANSAVALNTAKVSFPGFGTTHVLAAYGDHNHNGTYEVPLTFSTGLTRTGNTITNNITQYTDAMADSRVVAGITGKQNTITLGTIAQYFRGDLSLATMPTTLPASDVYAWAKAISKPSYNTSEVSEVTNLYYTDARARASISLTTTGSSGASTYVSGVLNVPTYTLAGLGGQPALNGTGFVKISGTTINYDNSIYLTSASLTGYVPYTGATGAVNLGVNILSASSINATGTAGTGFITLIGQSANPTSPTAGTLLLHSKTVNGFTRMEQDNEATTNVVYGRDNVFIVKNETGVTIPKGSVVYQSGVVGNVPQISLARANATGTLPALGVVVDNIAHLAFGQVMSSGVLYFNTSAFSDGQAVYVSSTTAGAMTSTRPSGTAVLVQRMGTIMTSSVTPTIGQMYVSTAPAILNMETGTISATWTGSAIVGTGLLLSGLTASKVVFTDASKNLTTTGIGTSSQFLKADGSVDSSTYLTTGTASSTYVPYTGATGAVNLGAYDLTLQGITIGRGGGLIDGNTVMGYQALYSNVTGVNNVAIGYQALRFVTNGNNTAVGTDALYSLANSQLNVGLGRSAGTWIADGVTANSIAYNCLYLGSQSKALSNGGDNEIVVGALTTGHGTNTVTIGNSSITANYFAGSITATGALQSTTATFTTIGTGTATSLLGVTSAGLLTTANTLNVITGTGTRTSNYIAKFNGSSNTISNSLIYDDGSKVGIGTTPALKLDVKGNSGDATTVGIVTTVEQVTLFRPSNDVGGIRFGLDTATGSAYIWSATSGQSLNFGTRTAPNNDVAMSLLASGFVGIGYTSDPTSGNKLAVNGNAYVNGTATFSSSVSAGDHIYLNANNKFLIMKNSSGSNSGYIGVDSSNNLRIENDNLDVTIQNASTINAIFKAGGNVGIGTTAPTEKLQINGSISILGVATTPKANSFILSQEAGSNASLISLGANGSTRGQMSLSIANSDFTGYLSPIRIYTNGDVGLVTSTGNVGIGTTVPGTPLEIKQTPVDSTTVIPMLRLTRDTSGTPTNGYGSSIDFWGKSANLTTYQWGDIQMYGENVTSNNRTGHFVVRLANAGGNLANILEASGGTAALGVGTAPFAGLVGLQVNHDIYFGTSNNAKLLSDGSSFTFNTNGTNKLSILSSGNVGIGTTAPGDLLDLYRTISGTASAVTPMFSINNYGNGNTAKIRLTDGVTNDGYITYTGGNSAAVQLLGFGNGAVQQMVINGNGNVGIGTTSPAYLLTVNGQPGANGYTAFTNYSDIRLKDNIEDMSYDAVLPKIMALHPVVFNYNSLSGFDQKTRDRRIKGFIAQELIDVFPEMVGEITINGGKYYDTNLSDMTLYLVKAVQELNQELVSLKQTLNIN